MSIPTKKIKVVFAVNDFLVGGVQRQITRQIKLYNKDLFDISIITLFRFPDKEEMYDLLPSTSQIYRLNFAGFRDIKSWLCLIKTLQSIRPDVVVSSLFFSNTVFRILKPFLGYKIISREHNTYFDKKFLEKVIDNILSYVTDQIVCVSNTVADFTAKQEYISRSKFKVIYNGIDLDEMSQLKDKCQSLDLSGELPRQGKMILNVARLTSQKNHHKLILAFNEFVKNNNDYYLVILGEGYLLETLKLLVKELEAENYIFLLGNKKNVECFYNQASFFVSASRMEGLSNAYLEALAFGLPIVSTKTAGTDEILSNGMNGYFIENDSIEAIIDALNKMVNVDNIGVMKDNALQTVKRFNIVNTVKAYETLIQQVF